MSTSTMKLERISFEFLPAEIICLIVDWVGALELAENKRLLRSEHSLCICGDGEQERWYQLKEQCKALLWHSGILKLSSLSRRLRAMLFASRQIRGISVPFCNSALDRLEDVSKRLKQDVR